MRQRYTKKFFQWLTLGWLVMCFGTYVGSSTALAQDDDPRQMYVPFQPDITTNFIKLGDSRHLGYIRVSVEAVVENREDMSVVEHHAPLLRDAFIQVFGAAQEGKVRSLTGREELRQECLQRAQALLTQETGRDVVSDIIFTTYLYQ